MEKTTATLIRRSRLTETSLIVHWCTSTHGLIKTVARGALRPRSPFAGRLDLFFEAELTWRGSRRSDLHTLSDVAVLDPRSGIQRDYPRLLAATYFVKLLELTAERETPVPELHDLLRRALDHLDREPATRRAVLHFEHELARLLGIPAERREEAVHHLQRAYHRIPGQRRELLDLVG